MLWSLNRASIEFGIDRRTLEKRLTGIDVQPGDDGYSTRDIVRAIYGDMEGEKLREKRAQADLAEMERDERAHLLIASELVAKVWTDALGNLRATVMAADIPKVTRAQLIKQLKDIPICDYTETTAPDDNEDSADGA